MKTIFTTFFACACCTALLSLTACQGESAVPSRATRAVESPGERNSATGE